MGDYIKIREFSEKFGISRQAVYQRIKKDLEPYIKKSNGETLIDTDAAILFAGATNTDNVDSQLTVNQSSKTDKLIDSLKDQITAKDEQISVLQAQITQLLKINQDQFTQFSSQADKLREQIKYQSEHIMQQSDRLSVLLSQQQYLTHTIAADPTDPQAQNDTTQIIEDITKTPTDNQPEQKNKPKFWEKLFGQK